MARLPRLSLGGLPHLLIQRGHNQQPAFLDDADKVLFHDLMGEVARAHGVAIHAFALRDAEVRMLLTPSEAPALGRMMQALGRRYGSAFNRRHGRTGGLWEGRFRATLIEPEQHLLQAMRWLDKDDGEGAVMSSRRHHIGEKHDATVADHPHFWSLGNTPFDREIAYARLLAVPLSAAEIIQLTDAVMKGWPLGSPAFVARLARMTARRLTPLPKGRPAKTSKAK